MLLQDSLFLHNKNGTAQIIIWTKPHHFIYSFTGFHMEPCLYRLLLRFKLILDGYDEHFPR